jgi:hypothetical protein
MTFDLADDRRRRIGQERCFPGRVESVHRFDQSDSRDLDQIIAILAAPAEPRGEPADDRHAAADDFFPVLTASGIIGGNGRHRQESRRYLCVEVRPGEWLSVGCGVRGGNGCISGDKGAHGLLHAHWRRA